MEMKRAELDMLTKDNPNDWKDVPLVHICECCGKTEVLTPDEAFSQGWDYPPKMGAFGIVSPRTCGDCGMTETIWWALVSKKQSLSDLDEKQLATIHRILNEPFSIMVPEGEE